MTTKRPKQPQLMLALDVPTGDDALALVKQLKPVGLKTYKVGMSLFYQEGLPVVRQIVDAGCEVFVDLKLHDIPSTVARTVNVLVKAGVTFLNVHCQGGSEMLRAAAEAAEEANIGKPVTVVGVTVLTSFSQAALQQDLKQETDLQKYVLHLATLAKNNGLDGVVCSAQEASMLRKACGEDFVLVTPGIRLPEDNVQDQTRILTPEQAAAAGADYLVVGRPIYQAPNPVEALQKMQASLLTAAL